MNSCNTTVPSRTWWQFYFQTTLLLPDSAGSWPLLAEEFTSFDLSYFDEEEDTGNRQRTNVQLEIPLVQVTNDINMEIPLQMFGVIDIFQVSKIIPTLELIKSNIRDSNKRLTHIEIYLPFRNVLRQPFFRSGLLFVLSTHPIDI